MDNDFDIDRWTEHVELDSDDGLPVPRLELRWIEGDFGGGYNWYVRYDLITRHLLDHIVAIPIGGTRSDRSYPPIATSPARAGLVDTPFRDNAHIRHDAVHLGLPAFAIYGEHVTRLHRRHEFDAPTCRAIQGGNDAEPQ